MGATDRYQLLVESQTRGDQAINRLNDTLARVADIIEKSNQRSAKSSKVATEQISEYQRAMTANMKIQADIRAKVEAAENRRIEERKRAEAALTKQMAEESQRRAAAGAKALQLENERDKNYEAQAKARADARAKAEAELSRKIAEEAKRRSAVGQKALQDEATRANNYDDTAKRRLAERAKAEAAARKTVSDNARRYAEEEFRQAALLRNRIAQYEKAAAADSIKRAEISEKNRQAVINRLQEQRNRAGVIGQNARLFAQSPIAAVGDAIVSSASGIGAVGAAIAGIAIGIPAAIIGFKNFVQAASESAREIQSLSQATGLSINQADKLRAASVLAGFDIRNLKEAALDLSQALRDTSGEGQRVRDLLQKLGVAAYTTDGAARNLNDVLLETFDALSKIEDTSTRVNLSRVIGGEDAAKSVQPLLTNYRALNAEAVKLGFGSREGLVKAMIEANAEIRKFDLQWEALKGRLSTGLTIPLKFINENFSGIVEAGKFSTAFGANPLLPLLLGLGKPDIKKEAIGAESLDRFRPKFEDPVGKQLAERFRAGQLGTETGLNARLQKLAQERGVIQQMLASGNLGQSAAIRLKVDLDKLESEQFQIETKLKRISERQSAIQALPGQIRTEKRKLLSPVESIEAERSDVKSLIGGQGGKVDELFNLRQADLLLSLLTKANADLREQEKELTELFDKRRETEAALSEARGVLYLEKIRDEIRRQEKEQDQALRLLDILRGSEADKKERDARFKVASFTIQSGVGDERSVAQFEANTRKAFALDRFNEAVRLADFEKDAGEKAIALERARADYVKERDDAEIDRRTRLLEIEKQRLETARGIASDFVGSIQSRNVGGFFRNQGGQLINQIGTNALAGPINSLLSNFGSVGAASGFGGLLKGTIFDPQNKAIDRNTLATEANTAALTGRSIGAGVPVFPGLSQSTGGAISVFGSDTNGITGRGPITGLRGSIGGGLGVIPNGGLFRGLFGGDYSVPTGDGRADTASNLKATTTAGRIANVAGSAAIVGFAALNATKAFKRGGASGNLEGISSVLGAAALIQGPQQPFVQAGALIAGFVAAALPDPKLKRDKEIDRLINQSIYNEPTSTSFDFDTGGNRFDYGRGGNIRPIQVVVNTMDAKSFSDNRDMIADAVRVAMYEGHSVNRAAREVVLAS